MEKELQKEDKEESERKKKKELCSNYSGNGAPG